MSSVFCSPIQLLGGFVSLLLNPGVDGDDDDDDDGDDGDEMKGPDESLLSGCWEWLDGWK